MKTACRLVIPLAAALACAAGCGRETAPSAESEKLAATVTEPSSRPPPAPSPPDLAAMAARDPTAAAEIARKIPAGPARVAAWRTIIAEGAREHAAELARFYRDWSGAPEGEDWLRHVASQWAAAEPQAAAAWALDVEPAGLREAATCEIAVQWAERDPLAAARLAVESVSPGPARDRTLVGVLQRWVQSDAESAALWAREFPEGGLRRAAIETVVSRWAPRDIAEAARWIDRLPPGADADTAITTLADSLAAFEPDAAFTSAALIADPGLRRRCEERVAREWLSSDRNAALRALRDREFSAEDLVRLATVSAPSS